MVNMIKEPPDFWLLLATSHQQLGGDGEEMAAAGWCVCYESSDTWRGVMRAWWDHSSGVSCSSIPGRPDGPGRECGEAAAGETAGTKLAAAITGLQ